MPGIRLDIDTSGVDAAAAALAGLMGQTEWITARAMTKAAAAGKRAIQEQILPRIEGGPSRWTLGGLISGRATPQDLRVQVGFRLGTGRFEDELGARGGSGVPAGEYMTTGVRGSPQRRAKSVEASLIRRGILQPNQRLIPNPQQLRNTGGNVSGATLKAIANRLQTGGDLQAAKDFRDSKKKRRTKKSRAVYSDYFVMPMVGGRPGNRYTPNAKPSFIAKRTGDKKRGFVSVLQIVGRASYERRFPIDKVAMDEFMKTFNKSFEDGVVDELVRRARKKYK